MARPLLEIDPIEVTKLAQLGCKTEEIADFLGCSVDTLDRRFAAELHKGRADLKMTLRRMQIQAAQKGNVVMMIWLGKQLLGQMERSQIDIAKIPDDIFLEEARRRLADGHEEQRRVAELDIQKNNDELQPDTSVRPDVPPTETIL